MALQLAKEVTRPWEQARAGIRTNFDLIELTVNGLLTKGLNTTNVLNVQIDNYGAVIATGVNGFILVPFACTLTGIIILSTDAAATSGSAVIDLWKNTYANYPPIVDNTIVASAKPTMISTNRFQDVTLSGWSKSLAANDVIAVQFDSVSTFTRLLVSLLVERA